MGLFCRDRNILTLESAVSKVLKDSSKFFLTVGNSPGSTIGVKYENKQFTDSHSRDNKGMCCPDGKALVLKLANTENFIIYVREKAQSLSTCNLQFEITCVSLKKKQFLQVNMSQHQQFSPQANLLLNLAHLSQASIILCLSMSTTSESPASSASTSSENFPSKISFCHVFHH